LLRIADGLDRPHLQQVKKLACEIGARHVVIRVSALAEPVAHIAGGSRKRGLFEDVFGRPVEFSIL